MGVIFAIQPTNIMSCRYLGMTENLDDSAFEDHLEVEGLLALRLLTEQYRAAQSQAYHKLAGIASARFG